MVVEPMTKAPGMRLGARTNPPVRRRGESIGNSFKASLCERSGAEHAAFGDRNPVAFARTLSHRQLRPIRDEVIITGFVCFFGEFPLRIGVRYGSIIPFRFPARTGAYRLS